MNKVYLLLGPDITAKRQFIQQLYASLSDPETYTYYAPELDIPSLISVLQTESLFHEHLLVCIQTAERMSDRKSLSLLLSSTFHSRAVLIFLSEEIKVPIFLEKAIPAGNKKIFWEMFVDRRVTWIMQYVERKGGHIEEAAAQTLSQLVTGSPGDFAEVLDSLIALQLDLIREEHVDAHIVHSKKETIFSLFEALSEKNLSRAVHILQILLLQREAEGRILYWLQSQFRKLRELSQLLADGMRPDEALQKLNIRGKNYQASCLKIARESAMDYALMLLAEVELLLRTQPEHAHARILELLLYHLIRKTERNISLIPRKMQTATFL